MFRERFDESLENIRMSPIVSISEEVKKRAEQFEKSGRPMLRFQRGEIDFGTPQFIIDAAKEGLDMGLTKYPKSGGEDFLKDAIRQRLERDYGVTGITPENIVVTYGGQEGLELSYKLFSSGAGFSPTWSCALENFVPYADLDFTEIPLNKDFTVDYERLEANIRGKDFFYLNNPQNPTGKVFSKKELDTIIDICTRNEVYVISDEAYEKFVYDDLKHESAVQYAQDNVISVFTLSKSYSMTGWRIGYVITRNKKISKLLRLGNYTQTAGVTTFIQHAAAKALDDYTAADSAVGEIKAEFLKRRDALYEGLRDVSGMSLSKPEGAFYIFPNFTDVIPADVQGQQREKYVYELLMQHGIATVYGSCFGRHFVDNVRLSFSATPVDQIKDAIGRFQEIFSNRAAA